ncbi:hypothetical protein [Zooshikella harenae]|uniref:Carbamoyl phosphate synthase ATP-binding domain-containing protein n=1 Tax=Zooshikella harenae TaxID=2827238 RepID=A0ABS5ZHP8_9GAMM|nr:hypothetical protein [Zooshikella harenae]MBU2713383.1 hypothetical protein [Zooshikella harenae]
MTGARAPVAIEWARLLMRAGHQVFLADSMVWPLGRFVKGIQNYIQLPSPRFNLQQYKQALIKQLRVNCIECIIPTCEEVFYLATIKVDIEAQLSGQKVEWFLPDHDLLFKLHNKFTSLTLLAGLGQVQIPATHYCLHPDDIVDDTASILKPVYSRFGRQVVRNPYQGVLTSDQINPAIPWVQQQKIVGQAICNYALFQHGKLIAHQAYLPKYCVNQSAASYFEPYDDNRLDEFVRQFGERTHYHGQVAFDFIEENNTLFVIECNPRATSGLHLLGFGLTMKDNGILNYTASSTKPYRLGNIIFYCFLFKENFKQLLVDYRYADDVFVDSVYPLIVGGQWLTLVELCFRCIRYHRPVTDVSTLDIEWDTPLDINKLIANEIE